MTITETAHAKINLGLDVLGPEAEISIMKLPW